MNDEIRTARNWVNLMNPVYLDTETTGLGAQAEVIQIAVIDDGGRELVNSLVKPTRPIPADSTAIHCITDADVSTAPSWPLVWPFVRDVVRNRLVIIYNADYDARLIVQSGQAHGISTRLADWCNYECAMKLYADFHAEWDAYHGNNKWQKLDHACRQMRIETRGLLAHAANGDCEMTRRLVHRIATHTVEAQHA